MPVTSGEDYSLVPWESWVDVDVGGGVEITFTDELGSGNFAPLPPRQLPGMRSMSRLQEHAPEAAFALAVHEKPDRHRPWQDTHPLNFHYDLADFRGLDGQSRLDVAYGLPPEALSRNAVLNLAIALTDSTQRNVYRATVPLVYYKFLDLP